MKFTLLTLFPEMFAGPFDYSIIKRGLNNHLLKIEFINIRDFGEGKHRSVDDKSYGGGVGMVMRVDIIDRAIKAANNQRPITSGKKKIILLDPKGKVFNQKLARSYAKLDHLILICGHYEGVDERVKKLVDETISIGDYVLTGGEIPALVIVDAVTRLIPGVLSKKEATSGESFSALTLEHPQYTKPPEYKGMKVPKILLSGNHQKINEWRQKETFKLTKKLRPDLL